MNETIEALFDLIRLQTQLERLPFNQGASWEAISVAERELGVKLPTDYVEFLKAHNGQSDPEALTFPPDELPFLSIEEVARLWTEYSPSADTEYFDMVDQTGRVRNILEHRGRLPIAWNEIGGHYLMIDNVPGPNGKEGQLVFNPNEADVVVVADSLTELFSTYIRLLETGKIFVSKRPPNFGDGYWFVSADGRALDWATFRPLRDAVQHA